MSPRARSDEYRHFLPRHDGPRDERGGDADQVEGLRQGRVGTQQALPRHDRAHGDRLGRDEEAGDDAQRQHHRRDLRHGAAPDEQHGQAAADQIAGDHRLLDVEVIDELLVTVKKLMK